MRAYWYDNLPGDQRELHDSGRDVDPEYLSRLGIRHYNFPNVEDVNKLAASRGYKNRDEVCISPTTLPNYEDKVKTFFAEHLHEDEEIRYIIDGGGFFDVRGKDDDWVRIQLEKHDLMIMPAGIYHRFTTDANNYTKAMRLFQDEPKWTPLQRGEETEVNKYRQEYLKSRDGVVTA
ncbi:1,2-dihydroxy-3-keto-5-methylthiopentene dioxygenase [Saccharata proteae CBS 121410]|uniref:Acireductone dioxygenase n=1 Tax=Saccharata proteae CBS 121410 TaxID=1314787 RepID=A0A9P4HUS9_9PEZI|nr:1,2-dihydroxy-3-keto-5-methylthiopentene dioxygenase [Saccharata proteae CBS 121410]